LSQFDRFQNTDTFNLPYDYESITHYSEFVFSKNGKKTIITKDPRYQHIIGKAKNLSKMVAIFYSVKIDDSILFYSLQDIKKLHIMYPKKE